MASIFVYGTLRHVPLLEVVLGREREDIAFAEAILPDYAVFKAQEGDFPLIVSKPGSDATGLLLSNLSDCDLERLNFYEGGYGYTLVTKSLRGGQTTQVYFPPKHGVSPGKPWYLRTWPPEAARLAVQAAHEVMSYIGTKSPEAVAQMYPMIRARAASTLAAQDIRHGDGTLQGRIDIHARKRVYSDYFALDTLQISHERFDGTMSDVLDRAVFMGTDAAVVLPYDPRSDRVLLVEQMRIGPIGRGDPNPWQLEPIAGRIDPGETPQECAKREAREEAGIDIIDLLPVAEAYPSPGTSSEFYYIYLGIADLPDDLPKLSGLDEEDEDLRVHILGFDDLMALVDNQSIANVPLALCAYWLARYRARQGGQG